MPHLSEEAIRPARLMADKEQCVAADRQFLLDRRDRWVNVDCPACGSQASREFGRKDGFVYRECLECETVYTNPRPSLALLHEFYAGSQNYAYWNEHIFPATETARRERIFRPRAQRLADLLRRLRVPTECLVEVGAAFGTFCEEMRNTGLFRRIIAVEPTPGLAATCRRRGFETIEDAIENVSLDAVADVVAAFEVIEHLFAPDEFVRHCARVLKPGGLLVLSCPNVRGFDVATLGMLSSTFDHEHLNYFHPQSLSELVRRCGFEVVECQTPGQLDADLVHRQVAAGVLNLDGQPFLQEILERRWDELGAAFQDFLANHRLSSHMWIIARHVGAAS